MPFHPDFRLLTQSRSATLLAGFMVGTAAIYLAAVILTRELPDDEDAGIISVRKTESRPSTQPVRPDAEAPDLRHSRPASGGPAFANKSAGNFPNACDPAGDDTTTKHLGTTPPLRIPPRQPWTEIPPTAPGNVLTVNGIRAEVTAYQMVARTPGVGLIVNVTEPPDEAGDLGAYGQQLAGHEPRDGKSAGYSYGLSYEQQLFRTKWGWATFDQVQKYLKSSR